MRKLYVTCSANDATTIEDAELFVSSSLTIETRLTMSVDDLVDALNAFEWSLDWDVTFSKFSADTVSLTVESQVDAVMVTLKAVRGWFATMDEQVADAEFTPIPAVLVSWTESEAGWGQRPDGYSVHLTNADVKAYIADYWQREKEFNSKHGIVGTPHEYSRPDSERGTMVVVSGRLRAELEAATKTGRCGLRLWSSEYSEHKAARRIVSGDDL